MRSPPPIPSSPSALAREFRERWLPLLAFLGAFAACAALLQSERAHPPSASAPPTAIVIDPPANRSREAPAPTAPRRPEQPRLAGPDRHAARR